MMHIIPHQYFCQFLQTFAKRTVNGVHIADKVACTLTVILHTLVIVLDLSHSHTMVKICLWHGCLNRTATLCAMLSSTLDSELVNQMMM